MEMEQLQDLERQWLTAPHDVTSTAAAADIASTSSTISVPPSPPTAAAAVVDDQPGPEAMEVELVGCLEPKDSVSLLISMAICDQDFKINRSVHAVRDWQVEEAHGRLRSLKRQRQEVTTESGNDNSPVAGDGEEVESHAPRSETRLPSSSMTTAELRQLKAENENLRLKCQCRSCNLQIANVLLLPCRHIAACHTCIAMLETCPEVNCNATFRAMVDVRWP